jgi:hypothetical protein
VKPTSLLPPVVALAIAGTWLGNQHQTISTLEQKSAALQKLITARTSGSLPSSSTTKPTSSTQAAKDKEPLDWKKIAAQMAERQSSGGMGDMRSMMKIHQRLQALSKEELVAALDEIAALDLPKESRAMLEQMLIGPLAEKDPELVLTRFIDRLQESDGAMSWQLAKAMQQWVKKDPASAAAWFDQQIAAGKFESKSLDGKSQTRLQFESNLINILLSSNPDAAGRRLAGLPEDQRDEALRQWSGQPLKDEDQAAFAKLVRDQIPEKEQARILAQKASYLVSNDGGYSKVTAFLDRIDATPAERTACVEQAAESKLQNTSHQKKITREDLDTMREWVTAQAPESTGTVTGKALANASQYGHKMEFSEAAELAVEYNSTANNDDVLSSFLDSYGSRQNKEQARVLAEKISDPKRREEILKNLK